MGGSFDYRTYDHNDRAKITKHFEGECETAKIEDGISYPGTIAAMQTVVDWRDKQFTTMGDAQDYLCDEHNKWDNAMAVSYKIAKPMTDRDKNRVSKAREKHKALAAKFLAVVKKVNDGFKTRKSKLIGCQSCGSRLSKDHLLRKQHRLSPKSKCDNPFAHALPGYGDYSVLACPLCDTLFISATELTRLQAYYPKLVATQEVVAEARVPKTNGKIGWIVGGWCSS